MPIGSKKKKIDANKLLSGDCLLFIFYLALQSTLTNGQFRAGLELRLKEFVLFFAKFAKFMKVSEISFKI